MYKRFMKKSVTWALVIAILVSFTVPAFAEDQKPLDTAKEVENVINHLSIYTRYPEATRDMLYQTAFEAVFDESTEAYEAALKAVLLSIDENSAYYNTAEAEELMFSLNDEVVGIGVNVFSGDGKIIVSEPIPGSPAEKMGIRSGDIIIGSDGFDLTEMDYEAAIRKIRGPEGSKAKITVLRTGVEKPITFEIVRARVVQNPVSYEIVEHDGKKIGNIRISSFTQTTAENFETALSEVADMGIKDIIIDVRDNGGGYIEQAVLIANMLLPKKGLIIVKEDYKIEFFNKEYRSSGSNKKFNIVMLVNERSASASEILIAALCENGAAKSVGTKTYGKGTVQSLVNTNDGGLIKYTSAYYTTPQGNNIHKKGIYPDVHVENTYKPVNMADYGYFSCMNKYKLGDKGEEVKLAKTMLQAMGLFIGQVNETYDENLKIAVSLFQSATGLFSYGVLDLTTQMRLYDEFRKVEFLVDNQLQAALDIF